MKAAGFTQGGTSPCIFYNPEKDIRAVIYGDDFTMLGAEHHLDWFKAQLAKAWEIDHKARLGPDRGDQKSVRSLNRVINWHEQGIQVEADQRHAEIIIRELG